MVEGPEDSIRRLSGVLEAPSASTEELQDALRELEGSSVTREMLRATRIGHVIYRIARGYVYSNSKLERILFQLLKLS